MRTEDQLVDYLAGLSLGTVDTDLFVGGKSVIPKGDGPFTALRTYGGFAGQRTQNLNTLAYEEPTVQIVVHSSDPSAGYNKAVAIRNALMQIENQTVGGTWYVSVHLLQSVPMDMGLDDDDRQMYDFNLKVTKRP